MIRTTPPFVIRFVAVPPLETLTYPLVSTVMLSAVSPSWTLTVRCVHTVSFAADPTPGNAGPGVPVLLRDIFRRSRRRFRNHSEELIWITMQNRKHWQRH